MTHPFNNLCLLLLCSLPLSAAPHTWTSTSGSTIEATYIGSFGDDLWFEGIGSHKKFLKMPVKYISAADLTLIETNEIAPQITDKAIDKHDASLALLEQLFKTKVPEPIEGTTALEDALYGLIGTLPQSEETKIVGKFHRKVDKAATRTEPINEPTVYACLQSLTEAHALKWNIRKGILNLRPR